LARGLLYFEKAPNGRGESIMEEGEAGKKMKGCPKEKRTCAPRGGGTSRSSRKVLEKVSPLKREGEERGEEMERETQTRISEKTRGERRIEV